MGTQDTTLQVVLSLKDDMSSGLKSAQGNMGSFGSAAETVGKVAAAAFLAIGAAVVGIGVEAVKQFAETQVATTKMNAALTAMGNGAINASAQFQDLADKNTALGFSVGDTETVLAKLALATGSTTQAMSDLNVVQDYARFTGADEVTAAKQIVLATEGKGRAYTALGINVKAAGSAANAFAELESKLSGQATAYSKTWAGAIAALGTTWNMVLDKIGGLIVSYLLPIITEATQYITEHREQITQLAQTILDWAQKIITFLTPAFNAIVKFFSDFENRKDVMIAVLALIAVGFTAWGVSVAIAFGPITLAILAFEAIVALLARGWDTNWNGMRDKLKTALADMITDYNNIKNALQTFGDKVKEIGKDIETHGTQIKVVAGILATIFGPAILTAGAQALAFGAQSLAGATAAMITNAGETLYLSGLYAVDFVKGIGASAVSLATWVVEGYKTITAFIIQTAQLLLNIAQWVIYNAITLASTIATGAMTAATWLLNAAFLVLTSPITLVVLAIVALIAIGVLMVTHWQTIKQLAGQVWNAIGNAIISMVNWAGNGFASFINDIIDGLNSVIKLAEKIPGAKSLGVSEMNHISFTPIPPLATGTNLVPQDMLAYIHQGEAVVPKQYNPAAGGNGGGASVGGGVTVNITGNNSFNSQADMDLLIQKIRAAMSRDLQRAKFGIAA